MKKHLSVFMLMARSSALEILLTLAAMCALEAGMLLSAAKRVTELENALAMSRLPLIFAAGFVLVTLLLCRTGGSRGAKTEYTLRRLSVSETGVFLWQALYNTLCYIILWGVQTAAALALCRLCMSLDTPANGGQTIYLAFYRNSFLHSLLPLEETSRYCRNILMAVGLGFVSAAAPLRRRRGEKPVDAVLLTAASLMWFNVEMGAFMGDVLLSAFSLACVGFAVCRALNAPASERRRAG